MRYLYHLAGNSEASPYDNPGHLISGTSVEREKPRKSSIPMPNQKIKYGVGSLQQRRRRT